MKIITVYFDDYKPIPVGVMAVEDKDAESVVKQLEDAIGDDEGYKVKMEESDTVEAVVAELRNILSEEEEDKK